MKLIVRSSIKRLVAVGEECQKDGNKKRELLWCTDSHAMTVGDLLNLKKILAKREYNTCSSAVRRSVKSLLEIGKACKRCGWKRKESCFSLGFIIGRREKDVNCCVTVGDLLNLQYL